MIRSANPADAEAVARVRARACRIAYADFVDPALLDAEPDLGVWGERLRGSNPVEHWVWDEGGQVFGFAGAGPATDADTVPEGFGCLYGLYVDPVAQGAGVGLALHDHALAAMRAQGLAQAVLWVMEGNERGRRFYEKHGWRRDDGVGDVDPVWQVPALRYSRAL